MPIVNRIVRSMSILTSCQAAGWLSDEELKGQELTHRIRVLLKKRDKRNDFSSFANFVTSEYDMKLTASQRAAIRCMGGVA